MPVRKLEILSREPYAQGRSFDNVGTYERIEAVAHYVIDPNHSANAGVVDLEFVERDDDGFVHFSGDVTMLRPISGGSRTLLMQVPNRGKRNITRFNMTVMGTQDTGYIDPGDGFLFNHGLTVAWAGWQWDVPRTKELIRIGLAPPQVPMQARTPVSQMQLRLQINENADSIPLTDHHVGELGMHEPIPPADADEPMARLLVRRRPYDPPEEILRENWHFTPENSIYLDGGFVAGLIYDVVYTPRDCPVVGAGMLATRDLASFLRYEVDTPTAGTIDYVVSEGQSQCGRFLRTYLYLGLNLDEEGRTAFDGILAHIAGGRRGEFNHRYGQPSVQPTPSFGHLFPFSDLPQEDPASGTTAGLLDRQSKNGGIPKIFYTDTSSEYWRGDASLSHTDIGSGNDGVLPDFVRRYLFAGTQHGVGVADWSDRTLFGSQGQNHMNIIDYRPLYRAALFNLLAWVRDDISPPDSQYPMGEDRTKRAVALEMLREIPGFNLPDSTAMTSVFPMDLGPEAHKGIGKMPPVLAAQPYHCWVSSLDKDGNETGGIAMPDIAVPVATHTGFNPRHAHTGGTGQLLEYIGSTFPFAVDKQERETVGDPRLSLAERYEGRNDYLSQVRSAAQKLALKRYILTDDIDLCVEIAAARYDICLERR